MAALGLPNLVLSRLRMRRINKFIDIFPNALDIIVRGVKAGLPLGDTLRIIANELPEPVRSEFRKLVEAQALGLPLPEAAEKLAERVPISETNFFSIVIGIQSKSGGNLSEAIGNLSRTLRERKKMKGKIKAMAMEAKASAAIIGADHADAAQPPRFFDPDAQRRSNRQPTVGADAAPGDHACRVFLPDAADAPKGRPGRQPTPPKPRIRRLVRINPRHASGSTCRKPQKNRQIPEQPQATRPERTVRLAPTWSAMRPACGRLRTVARRTGR